MSKKRLALFVGLLALPGLLSLVVWHFLSAPKPEQASDHGLLTAPIPIGGSKPYIDATQAPYLADSTGVTDSAAAVNKAITAAGVNGRVYLPAGSYLWGSGNVGPASIVTLSQSGFELFGDGAGATIIRTPNNAQYRDIVKYLRVNAHGCHLHDFSILGGTNPTGSQALTATIVSGGASYADGDTITLGVPGGVYSNANIVLTIKVGGTSGGVIQAAGVNVTSFGSWSTNFSGTVGQSIGTGGSSSGSGTGATFTIGWYTGTDASYLTQLDTGAFDCVVERCEFVGAYGNNTGGGSCCQINQTWNNYEYTPTLGTGVSAGGVATVTPSSPYGCGSSGRIDVDTGAASGKQCATMGQIQAPGTSYVVADVLTEAGNGTGTHSTWYVGALRTVSVASIVSGGASYANNDTIQVSGGTLSQGVLGVPTVLKVTNQSGGVIQAGGLSIVTPGSYSTTPGAGTLTTTTLTGSGSGATVTLTYSADQVGSLTCPGASAIAAAGSGYSVNDILTCAGGTFGIPAHFLVMTVNGSGGVTSVRPILGGTYSAAPGNPVSTTAWSGASHAASAGSGCTLTLNAMVFVNGIPAIQGPYTAGSTNPCATSGGTGTSATINVTFAPEPVVVLFDDKTTFTSYFQFAHTSAAACGTWSYPLGQHCVIRDCYFHDSLYSTGIVGSGNGIVVQNCRFSNIGAYSSTQGGIYWQGNNAVFDSCRFWSCGAFSLQIQQSSPSSDGSHNKVIGCTSVDPGLVHLVINQANSPNQIISSTNYNGNPYAPLGESLNRTAEIVGCTFRCTNQAAYAPATGLQIALPVKVIGCTFEDAGGALLDARNTWVSLLNQSTGTKFANNTFRCLNGLANGTAGATVIGGSSTAGQSDNIVIDGNTFENIFAGSCVNVSAGKNWIIRGNNVTLANQYQSTVFANVGAGTDLSSNIISGGVIGGAGSNLPHAWSTNGSGWRIHDNDMTGMPAACCVCQTSSTHTGQLYNNNWTGTTGLRLAGATPPTSPGYIVYSNDGPISNGGTAGAALTRDSGRIVMLPSGTGGTTKDLFCKVDGTGNVVLSTTADSPLNFFGICASTNNASLWVPIAGQPGTVYPSLKVEAAGGVTAGHYGTLSTTTAATVHDAGTSVPAAGVGYVLILTTAGANGNCAVMVMGTTR